MDKALKIAILCLVSIATAYSQVMQQAVVSGGAGSAGFLTYTDNFTRANAVLSAPWAEPASSSTGGDMQIISNQTLAHGTQPGAHYLDIYTGGTFGNNQYSIITANTVATSGPFATQGAIVRGKALNQYYNDIIPNPTGNSGGYALGIDDGSDFCTGPVFEGATSYTVGDTHELDVVGSGPVFFWARHNGVIEMTCVDNTTNYTGGVPGFGSVVDMNSTPTVASGPWTGGTLPALSATHTDNFVRADAGWLGVNWWFIPTNTSPGHFCGYTLASNKASSTCTLSGDIGAALWTTPFVSTQDSEVTWGAVPSGGWQGPIVRATPGQIVQSYYLAIYFSGSVTVYAASGGSFNSLGSPCSPATPTTIGLTATGTSPVVLQAKVNGSNCGTSISDSSFKLTGAYEGFATAGAANVAGWTGN
jgi:hypothetical protein